MGVEDIVTVPSFYGLDLVTGALIIGYFELFSKGIFIYFDPEVPEPISIAWDGTFFYIEKSIRGLCLDQNGLGCPI